MYIGLRAQLFAHNPKAKKVTLRSTEHAISRQAARDTSARSRALDWVTYSDLALGIGAHESDIVNRNFAMVNETGYTLQKDKSGFDAAYSEYAQVAGDSGAKILPEDVWARSELMKLLEALPIQMARTFTAKNTVRGSQASAYERIRSKHPGINLRIRGLNSSNGGDWGNSTNASKGFSWLGQQNGRFCIVDQGYRVNSVPRSISKVTGLPDKLRLYFHARDLVDELDEIAPDAIPDALRAELADVRRRGRHKTVSIGDGI